MIQFFDEHHDPNLFMERHALKRSEFRKIISPLMRSGHVVQDYRGGFRRSRPSRTWTSGT